MLYFGSFNPIHNGHIALAEYAIEAKLCDDVVMVVSPQNPLKAQHELVAELERFTMAELSCGSSKYPGRIKASVIEFMLPKPSYTINTLRHLTNEYGSVMDFSILIGADLVEQLEHWRNYQEILDNYKIYVYPRSSQTITKHLDQITVLNDAPLFDISSTEIRRGLMYGEDVSTMVSAEVLKHIKENGFWSDETLRNIIESRIEMEPNVAIHYLERGRWHYRHESWGDALNDFNRTLDIDPSNLQAKEMAQLTKQILEFRYTDIYNP